tara:strand:- start:931 stop:1263 length:333 start_codon:yes stop_codon:yes gene_type:complete
MYEYNARLIRVIDGDTIEAMVDLGFDVWTKQTIRLHGIDTPEVRTRNLNEKKLGLAAKERLSEIFSISDGKFLLKSRGIGRYGRCLGILYIKEQNINELLISEGHAKEYK